MSNTPPFYVGQRVVAITSHSQGVIKKGEEFIIRANKKFDCCGIWCVDIGQQPTTVLLDCNCGQTHHQDKVRWFGASLFVPIHENFQSITLEKILEEETKWISVN